jgi:hypothetical protein
MMFPWNERASASPRQPSLIMTLPLSRSMP